MRHRESFRRALSRWANECAQAPGVVKRRILIAWLVLGACGYLALSPMFSSFQLSPFRWMVFLGMAVATWMLAFKSGVDKRVPGWTPTYPPFDLIKKAVPTSILTSVLVASLVRLYLVSLRSLAEQAGEEVTAPFELPLRTFVLTGAVSWVAVWLCTVVLFRVYAPITQGAYKTTGDLTIISADAYRGTWTFSALAVLGVCLFVWLLLPLVPVEGYLLASATVAIAVSLSLSGFASGYIP